MTVLAAVARHHGQPAYFHETLGSMTNLTETARREAGVRAMPTGVVDRAS